MSIFRIISDTLTGLVKRYKQVDPVSKNDVLDLIGNNIVLLRLVVTTFTDYTTLFTYIQKELLPANGSNKANEELRSLYVTYVANLNGLARQQENSGLLRSISSTASILLADHESMLTNFDMLFKNGTDEGEISLEQIKLSHAAIFGYINLSNLFADWFCFFVGQLQGVPGENMRIPAYRIGVVRDSGKTVADFVTDVLQRGPNRGILTLLQTVRSAGDVAIYTTAANLDSYANINDYPGIKRLMNPFAGFQPILFIREKLSTIVRSKYKRNLAMREWIQAKLIVLQMDANRMDPQSPEYVRQKQIMQRYSDELARLDAQIDRYENG